MVVASHHLGTGKDTSAVQQTSTHQSPRPLAATPPGQGICFKQVNEQLGLTWGDDVLRRQVRTLQADLDEADTLVRLQDTTSPRPAPKAASCAVRHLLAV